jgi:hypothetical protein
MRLFTADFAAEERMRAKAVGEKVSFAEDKGNLFTDSRAKSAAGERIAGMEVALQRGGRSARHTE